MATKRLSMRKTREILRQKWALGRSHREVARSLSVSVGTIGASLARAREAGLTWAEVEALRDSELEAKLYGAPEGARRPLPDFADIHRELHRTGVTLQLLHLEYLEQHSDGYGYTQFCRYYKRWLSKQQRSMRQIHRAGAKLFVDYSGKKPHIVDPKTGEVQEVELFVAALGASSCSFAEATRTQQLADFLASHVRAFEYFGGVTEAVVPDQLKTAVTRACRYEPGIQRDYGRLAEHYDTVVLPARPGKPRDKAKVEAAVLVVQRWILARLRNETFFSLGALNRRIAELLEELNQKPMRVYGASRRELFEQLDQPALKPLPQDRFHHGQWKDAKVNIDYHVEIEKHYYSVPHALVHEQVEVCFTATTVEIFHDGRRLASHVRSQARGRHTTQAKHMPKSHQQHLEWTPSRLISWGASIGPDTGKLVAAILDERRHPEQGYRSCLGILRLGKRYGEDRLEAACARALVAGARSYRHLETMLRKGLDRMPLPTPRPRSAKSTSPVHSNVRGGRYYHDSTQQGELTDAERTDSGEAPGASPERAGGDLVRTTKGPADDGSGLR
jgi:transposase